MHYRITSLSTKITIAVLAAVAATVVVHILLGYWGSSRLYSEILYTHGGTLARYLSAYVEHQMQRHEGNDLSILIQGIRSWEEVGTVRLLDENGIVKISTADEETGKTYSLDELSPRGRTIASPAQYTTFVEGEDGSATIWHELPNREYCRNCHSTAGPNVGYIEIVLSPETIASQLKPQWRRQVISGLVILTVLCVITIGLIHSLIVKRIHILSRAVEKVETGDFSVRISATSGDELSHLAERFNQMIAELGKSRRELEEAHRNELLHFDRLATIGELSTGLAHEIRNPLAAISGALQRILKSKTPMPGHQEIIQEVHQQVVRMDETVRKLLAFAQAGEMHVQDVDVNEIVQSSIQVLNSLGRRQASHEIQVELAQNLPHIEGDPKLMQQALMNLILNAYQSQSENGAADVKQVIVSTMLAECQSLEPLKNGAEGCCDHKDEDIENLIRCPDGAIRITVRDFGPGLPDEVLHNMFKPFFTTKAKGTGLGLSVSHRIIVRHRGCLYGKNVPGGGALFVICLPAKKIKKEESTNSEGTL